MIISRKNIGPRIYSCNIFFYKRWNLVMIDKRMTKDNNSSNIKHDLELEKLSIYEVTVK